MEFLNSLKNLAPFSRKKIGQKGEKLASQWLEKQGFKLLKQNWRTKQGEVDLIAQKGKELFFIEVKFRQSSTYGSAWESIHTQKQKRLLKASLHFLQRSTEEYAAIKMAALIIEYNQSIGLNFDFREFPLDLSSSYY